MAHHLIVIPVKAGIQSKHALHGTRHKKGFEYSARRIKTGFRPSPE